MVTTPTTNGRPEAPDYSKPAFGDELLDRRVDNPYLPSVRDNNDLAASLETANTRLWLAIKGAAVIMALLVVAIGILASRPPQIGALVIDKTVGSWRIAQLPTVASTPDIKNQLATFFLPVVVESAFTVTDVDGDKRNLVEFVRPFIETPSQAATFLNGYIKDHDPAEVAKRYRVSVSVDPVPAPKGPDEYVIGWTETTRTLEGQQVARIHKIADMTIRWGTANAMNPGGLYVETMSLLDSGPTPTETTSP